MSSATSQRMNNLLQFDWSLSTIRAGTEDAKKILSNDGACPICDQVLSKSHMKPVDVDPNDDWTNVSGYLTY